MRQRILIPMEMIHWMTQCQARSLVSLGRRLRVSCRKEDGERTELYPRDLESRPLRQQFIE